MSYPYPPRAEIGRTLLPEPVAPVAPDDQPEMDALVEALSEQHRRKQGCGTIHCSGVDDNRATGGGVTCWFDCDGYDYGLVRGRIDLHRDGRSMPDSWVDCDGSTLDFPEESMSVSQISDAVEMAAELVGDLAGLGVPAAPESTEALDDYDQLCRDAHGTTFCAQCGDPTTKQEGLLCNLCVQEDGDARDEHERDHRPGMV